VEEAIEKEKGLMIGVIKNNVRTLNGYAGLFLDSVRILCALIVLLEHCSLILVPGWLSLPFAGLRHGAVIVFFVLSGFVIAHTTSSRKRTFEAYLVSRFSRLYSIFIPAIVVTIVCAVLAFLLNPGIYFQYDRGSNIVRYFITLFFCNELWFTSSAPPINSPFWSLGFEFWYYMFFAFIYYKAANFKGVISIILICFFAGPKILVMFPLWCLGWLAYKIPNLKLNIHAARIFCIIFLVLSFIMIKLIPPYPGIVGYKPLFMANAFMSDILTGIFAAASIWLLPTKPHPTLKESAPMPRFRFYANLTYPVYLMHFPILVLCSSILLKYNFNDLINYCVGLGTTLAICLFLGSYFEKRKGWWYSFFDKLIHEKKLSFRPVNTLVAKPGIERVP
jgi:peptidoglycan/LPS O-acetylase OafA/YrhL